MAKQNTVFKDAFNRCVKLLEQTASLPSEPELGATLGVSRTTVRAILTRLEEVGRFRRSPLVVVGDDGGAARQACELLAGEGFRYVIFVPEGAEGLFAGVRGADAVSDAPEDRR